MFNNYNNGNFNNNLNPNNLFNTNNQYNNINQNGDYEKGDVPPKLDPIKNLSEATASVAPTMDVLAPMNIMPESFSNPQDKLDEYENGVNFQNVPKQYETNYAQINNPTLNEYSLEKNNISNILGTTLQQDSNIPFGVQSSEVNSLINPAIQSENSNLVNIQQNSIQNSEENALGQNNNPSFDITNNNIDITPPIMESQNSNLNRKDENTYGLNNLPLTSSFNTTAEFNSINLGMDKELESDINSTDAISQNALQEEVESTKQTEDYTILQDNIEEPQLDLGITNEFDNDFDTLDILDIEDPSLDDDNSTEVKSDGETTLITNVEKIKKLISEIKNTGVEISFEEFDFENMYQLIVKINK